MQQRESGFRNRCNRHFHVWKQIAWHSFVLLRDGVCTSPAFANAHTGTERLGSEERIFFFRSIFSSGRKGGRQYFAHLRTYLLFFGVACGFEKILPFADSPFFSFTSGNRKRCNPMHLSLCYRSGHFVDSLRIRLRVVGCMRTYANIFNAKVDKGQLFILCFTERAARGSHCDFDMDRLQNLFFYLKFYILYATISLHWILEEDMKKKLCEEYDIAKKCAFCEHASKTLDSERMICKKKGIVHAEYTCRAFRYDLMKRQPRRLPLLQKEAL